MISGYASRIFIVDDHRVVRMGFRIALEQLGDFTVAGEAASGEEALTLIPETQPDLAIVDIAMDGMDGIELTRRLHQTIPTVRVLIVSTHNNTFYVEEALKAGADGYVLKDNADALMIEATEAILDGRRYLCEEVASKVT